MHQFYRRNGPIIACSSGRDAAGLAVLRLSGFDSIAELAGTFFQGKKFVPRYSHFCCLVDGDKVLDEVMATYFPGPRSFTGENVLEISVHGNPLNVRRIIDLFIEKAGFSPAGPGEFSFRAFRNKKLSLGQIEGLDLLLNAKSEFAIDQGLSLIGGELFKRYEQLRADFINLRASLEMNIDFSEDIGDQEGRQLLAKALERFERSISGLHDQISTEGNQLCTPQIVLYGLPNVGKSTLFNYLLGSNRAIVSDQAGTTRDYLSETIFWKGVQYRLVDTAGIRDGETAIEEQGILMGKEQFDKSFFKVHVVKDQCSSIGDLLVVSHGNCHMFGDITYNFGPMGPVGDGPIEPAIFGPIEPVEMGGPMGPRLKSFILDKVHDKYLKLKEKSPILLERHREEIKNIYTEFQVVSPLLKGEFDVGIIDFELNLIRESIERLIGVVAPDQVLNSLFENFCIGK